MQNWSWEEAEEEYQKTQQWIDEQLHGVLDPSWKCYRVQRQLFGLFWYDCMAMQSADEGVLYVHWASEFEPRSWAWLF